MKTLIHVSAPSSSTEEERRVEEKRVQRMFPDAGVVCLLEDWKIQVHDIPSRPSTGVTVQAFEISSEKSPEQVRNVVAQAIEDAAKNIGNPA